MREIRLSGSEGGGAVRSPYPYPSDAKATSESGLRCPNCCHPESGGAESLLDSAALIRAKEAIKRGNIFDTALSFQA